MIGFTGLTSRSVNFFLNDPGASRVDSNFFIGSVQGQDANVKNLKTVWKKSSQTVPKLANQTPQTASDCPDSPRLPRLTR